LPFLRLKLHIGLKISRPLSRYAVVLRTRAARRSADYGGSFGHIIDHDSVGPDLRARADPDAADHLRSGSDTDI
jgi:hypothetical protein